MNATFGSYLPCEQRTRSGAVNDCCCHVIPVVTECCLPRKVEKSLKTRMQVFCSCHVSVARGTPACWRGVMTTLSSVDERRRPREGFCLRAILSDLCAKRAFACCLMQAGCRERILTKKCQTSLDFQTLYFFPRGSPQGFFFLPQLPFWCQCHWCDATLCFYLLSYHQ